MWWRIPEHSKNLMLIFFCWANKSSWKLIASSCHDRTLARLFNCHHPKDIACMKWVKFHLCHDSVYKLMRDGFFFYKIYSIKSEPISSVWIHKSACNSKKTNDFYSVTVLSPLGRSFFLYSSKGGESATFYTSSTLPWRLVGPRKE